MPRHRNENLRKRCGCPRQRWTKCPHSWCFNFKPRGGRWDGFSLDAELGRHLATKEEAKTEVARIKAGILAGTFKRSADVSPMSRLAANPARPTRGQEDLTTLDAFVPRYLERVKATGKVSWRNDASMFVRLRTFQAPDGRRLGEWTLSGFTEDTLETFFASLLDAGFAASTRNKYVQVLKAAFRWAARKGYLSRSPISEDSSLKRTKVAQRRRRLSPEEEIRLLAAAGLAGRGVGLRLQWIIVSALETGARRGELLSIRWADVDLGKRTVLIRAVEHGAKKTARPRELPMSAKLAAILEMAETDAKTRSVHAPTAYVFGDATGRKVNNIKRAWETALLKAHGHQPEWVRSRLSAADRMKLATIDLHFHDLRHEAGCRWLENGVPLHHVQELLGHTNLAQTSTYLHASEFGLRDSIHRYDVLRGTSVAQTRVVDHPPACHDEVLDTDKHKQH